MKRVILVEFNELSPALMQQFMDDGKLPNFRRLFGQSQVFTTDAGEEAPYLNPWIQWVTVHSGMPYSEHRVFELGEGHKLEKKCIWDVAKDAGMKSWICGAMNVRFDPPINGWLLPDPWTVGTDPHPETLRPYFKFVQTNVQEYTNDRVPLTRTDYYRFLAFMLRHGLSATTIFAIAKQLLSERLSESTWKRATILDKLQFDLFSWYYRREKPAFSLFFVNSTAHFQHKYWRNMEPEKFKIQPSDEEQSLYKDAILYGYQQMDRLIGRFEKLLDENTTLVFATALSQQPCLAYEDEGGKTFYRPRDFDRFLRFAGLAGNYTVSPVMSEQFHVFFGNETEAVVAHDLLAAVRVNGRQALSLERRGNEVFAGCGIFDELPHDATLTSATGEHSSSFFDIFYQVEGIKSGMHHPDGMLWIHQPDRLHRIHNVKVPLTEVASMLLGMLDLPKPDHMRGNSHPRPGSRKQSELKVRPEMAEA